MNSLSQAIRTFRTVLKNNTIEEVREKAPLIQLLHPDVDINTLIKEMEKIINVIAEDARIIESSENKPWLSAKKAEIKWNFWNRYKIFLEENCNYPPDVILKLDKLTDTILDKTFDPTKIVKINKKGLVVGHVQSGKTSNYVGLICKAADAGFKVIIVLAGIHNSLRSQTQLRIDEGFLGKDSNPYRTQGGDNRLGVGFIPTNGVRLIAHSVTSNDENGDINKKSKQGLNFDTEEPIIFVVKKNPTVLESLYEWLKYNSDKIHNENNIINSKSLLLIDDEADNASINTKKEIDEGTKINKQIRSIIYLFERYSYIGYTATPFANLFMNTSEEDLFPRDFIINIPAPSNYIGASKIFGIDEDNDWGLSPLIVEIDDYQDAIPDGHKKDTNPPSELPPSMEVAIRCFIIVCAIRILRGQAHKHNSMLIHVTRYKKWQESIKELVEKKVGEYKKGIDQNDKITINIFKETMKIFEKTFNENFIETSQKMVNGEWGIEDASKPMCSWEEVLSHLNSAVEKIKVREINGNSKDTLSYIDNPDGLSVIAIGGDKLSRGLTLEGLSISYYLRASKMYDTLMQMGRWFGYRDGYLDLCRLFTSSELCKWYGLIAAATEELRREFDYMSEVVGARPIDYALKVRSHPEQLMVTAPNKMRLSTTVQIGFSGILAETYWLKTDISSIKHNLSCFLRLGEQLGQPESLDFSQKIMWKTSNIDAILAFLTDFMGHPKHIAMQPGMITKYIKECTLNNELNEWIVIVPNVAGNLGKFDHEFNFPDFSARIGLTMRSGSVGEDYKINKSHIIDRKHEYFDFENIDENDQNKKYILENRPSSRALLLIYPLSPVYDRRGVRNVFSDANLPIMSYAISFPKSSRENPTISYKINSQLLEKLDLDIDYEDYD